MSSPSEPTGLVVHYLRDSRSQRIPWLLEELGVPYDIKIYERGNMKLAPPELAKIHPLGKSPVITDGHFTLAESGAIVEYIITKYGKGKGQALPEGSGWIDNLYYSHYAEGTLMPLLVWTLILKIAPEKSPFVVRPIIRGFGNALRTHLIDPQLKTNVTMIDEHLKKNPGKWFAGGEEPTSADYLMLFPLEVLASSYRTSFPIPDSILEYVKRVHNRPAYHRTLERCGDYAYSKL